VLALDISFKCRRDGARSLMRVGGGCELLRF